MQEMTKNEFPKELIQLVEEYKKENCRLRIENGLLRKASEEQRKLNGALRVEIQKLEAVGKAQS